MHSCSSFLAIENHSVKLKAQRWEPVAAFGWGHLALRAEHKKNCQAGDRNMPLDRLARSSSKRHTPLRISQKCMIYVLFPHQKEAGATSTCDYGATCIPGVAEHLI